MSEQEEVAKIQEAAKLLEAKQAAGQPLTRQEVQATYDALDRLVQLLRKSLFGLGDMLLAMELEEEYPGMTLTEALQELDKEEEEDNG